MSKLTILTVIAAFGIAAGSLLSFDISASAAGTHHFHHRPFWPYGGVFATAPAADYVVPVASVAPMPVNPAIKSALQCTHSQEIRSVPTESGGELKVTITRC